MENLQVLITGERKKESQSQQIGQEKGTDIQHMQKQLARLEADRYVCACALGVL